MRRPHTFLGITYLKIPPGPHSHESGNPEDGYRLSPECPPRRPGSPTRRPGESRGLGERCPLDSGFRRNDEGVMTRNNRLRDRLAYNSPFFRVGSRRRRRERGSPARRAPSARKPRPGILPAPLFTCAAPRSAIHASTGSAHRNRKSTIPHTRRMAPCPSSHRCSSATSTPSGSTPSFTASAAATPAACPVAMQAGISLVAWCTR